MKFQDSRFNGLKVTVGTESVKHPSTHALTDTPKAICPINFFKVGGIINQQILGLATVLTPTLTKTNAPRSRRWLDALLSYA